MLSIRGYTYFEFGINLFYKKIVDIFTKHIHSQSILQYTRHLPY